MKAPQVKLKNRPESWLEAELQFGKVKGPRKAKAYFGTVEANQRRHLLLSPLAEELIFLKDVLRLSSYILEAAMRCALL